MSSSGTSSGRNLAGVTHGNLELTGNKVTIISPFAERVKKLLAYGKGKFRAYFQARIFNILLGSKMEF